MKSHAYKFMAALVMISSATLPVFSVSADSWRLNDELNFPVWFSLTGQHRSRFENLDEQYRVNFDGGDQILVFRTLVRGEIDFNRIKFVGEMIDSRSRMADSGTPLTTSVINPIDLLQAYIEVPLNNLITVNSVSSLRLGRLTMDVGSRRLVARNRYRNTINNFTGVDWQWVSANKNQIRLFYTLPVHRLVDGNILDNHPAFDKQDEEVTFWGLYFSSFVLPWGNSGEVYLFGLEEDDTPRRSTSDRDIYTIGFRLFEKASKAKFDYEIESVFQFGESRRSRTSTIDLDHEAFFQHVEVGYTFNHPWSPRVILQYDYASGDSDPNDNENNRFDTLFGARRFDFGPTSIYGPFARANLSSPGIRFKFKPIETVSSFFALRGFWLASSDDAWTTAGIRSVNGNTYIGTQIEGRIRWDLLPGNLKLESGAAYLISGDVMDDANKDNSTYVYTQISISF